MRIGRGERDSRMAREGSNRRRHKRTALNCPVTVCDRGGQALAGGDSLNISDGGMLLSIRVEDLPALRTAVNVAFSVPRETPNTFMLEDFASPATVIRHGALVDEARAAVALRFGRPVSLALEV